MGKYIFNEIFKEIIDTYYIDSSVLGNLIDRDSSRIRHYKADSRPGKAVLDKLIKSICEIVNEKNDIHTNVTLKERLNDFIKTKELFTEDLRNTLHEIEETNLYIAFLLRKSIELNLEIEKVPTLSDEKLIPPLSSYSLITKINQAHQYFENNLYQEAIEIYEDILEEPILSELLLEKKKVYSNLGLIYRNIAFSQYDYEKIQQSIDFFHIASKLSLEVADLLDYALISKYLGTIYTFLFNFKDSEKNLKKAIEYYDASLSELLNLNNMEEYSKVLINYGVLFIYYADIRNTRNFLKNAISYLNKAIAYFDTPSNSYFKALAYKNCSAAYSLLAELCNTEANATQAIEMTQNALKVFTIEDYPVVYAQCVSNLGHTHYIMATSMDPISNCNKSINYINHALSIVTEEIDANSFCIAHLNLSAVYILLSNYSDKQENIELALESLKQCKRHYNVQSNSMNHLKTNINYASVLIEIGDANLDVILSNEANDILLDLLELCNTMKLTYYKAVINYCFARIHFTYYKTNNSSEDLNNAHHFLNNAFLTFNINDYPLNYAHTMHLAAKIYDNTQDYIKSKQAYETILRIFTREKYPDKYKEIIGEYNQLMYKRNILMDQNIDTTLVNPE